MTNLAYYARKRKKHTRKKLDYTERTILATKELLTDNALDYNASADFYKEKYCIADDAGTIYAHDVNIETAENIIDTLKESYPDAENIEIIKE